MKKAKKFFAALLAACMLQTGELGAAIPASAANSASSGSPSVEVLSDKKDAELHTNLQKRIDEILNTKTKIRHSDTFIPGKTYTGTAYYVSNDGDDNNDGLTPETAFRTLTKVMELNGKLGESETMLQPGDAVFFRRGDIFRLSEGELPVLNTSKDRITYSAYGKGEKPIITASSENGTGAEKWKLIYEDKTGKKIWQYYRDMRDVSRIVFNNGEVLTDRVYEYYDEKGYTSCEFTDWTMHEDNSVKLLDKLLPLKRSMTEDMTIISRPKRTSPENNYRDDTAVGPLYLRCDAGNPGEIYDSVEFTEYYLGGIVTLESSDTVFDNISFRCGGNSYMKSNDVEIGWENIRNTVIQNCEFAFGGGTVTDYLERENGTVVVGAQGDGIYLIVRNTTIQNNYFHDGSASDGTYEDDLSKTNKVDGYYHFLNNVSVNTIGIRLDSTAVPLHYLDSVKICGNQVWNTGRMDHGKLFYSEGSLVLMPNHYGECIVEDNVFYGTENGHPSNALLDIFLYDFDGDSRNYTRPKLGKNTYVQYAGRDFAAFLTHNGEIETWDMDDPELLTKTEKYLHDTTSEFYVIPSGSVTVSRTGNAKLSWRAQDRAESYTVYQAQNGKWVKFGTTSKTTYTVKSLTNNKTYRFMVRAKVGGKLVAKADAITLKVKVYYKPAPKATTADGKITISWEEVPDATKYRIYTVKNGKLVKLKDTTKLEHSEKATVGKTYQYAVKAYVDGKWTSVKASDIVKVKAK